MGDPLFPWEHLPFKTVRRPAIGYFCSSSVSFLVFFLENKIAINETQLPDELISILFVLNISGVTVLMFYLLRYFVSQNEHAKERLKHEQAMLEIEQEKLKNYC